MIDLKDKQVVILCGGKGTRLRDVTELLPKPMVNIGQFPIVFHIMKWYAKFGLRRFILCLGYKKECFISYFTNFMKNTSDLTINLKDDTIKIYDNMKLDWEITLVDTGLETKTGKRLKLASKYLDKDDDFFLTYGDGVSDVNIRKLYEAHCRSGKALTLTIVNIPSRFGLIDFDSDDDIICMNEKNKSDGYINGGFMVLKYSFIKDYIERLDDVFLEQEPMNTAIEDKQVHAYKHDGFWQCMDNAKEYELLNNLWKSGKAKWKAD